jgi:hypothetical protein
VASWQAASRRDRELDRPTHLLVVLEELHRVQRGAVQLELTGESAQLAWLDVRRHLEASQLDAGLGLFTWRSD